MSLRDAWENEAESWAEWARTPEHDSYWHFNRAAFLALVPLPGGRTLDLACGEGRVARDLTALGHAVVGVDSSPTLVRLAEEADARSKYVVGDAAALPFEAASFDLVIAFNSLMDLDDIPAGVREGGRVLRAGGRFCISVTHPLNDAAAFTSEATDAPFVVTGSYFARERFQETLERDGLRMTFNSQAHPLEDYAGALQEAGFVVEAMREPVPDDGLCEREPRYRRWRRVPMFLHLRACKGYPDAAATESQSVTRRSPPSAVDDPVDT